MEGNEKIDAALDPQDPAIAQAQIVPPNGTAIKRRGICVALPQGGKPVKLMGDGPSDFLPILQNSTFAWINFSLTDLEKDGTDVSAKLGFSDSLVPSLLKNYHSNYEDREIELGIKVPAVKIIGLDVISYDLIILVRRNLILSMHSEKVTRVVQLSRYADTYMRKYPASMPMEDKLTNMLIRILDENNNRNFEQLREIEEQADALSKQLSDPKTPRDILGTQIYGMKHSLISYLNALWRTLDVLNSLRHGDADTITDNNKVLVKIGLLADDVNRQISTAEHTSDVLASGLEVLQSLYNNQLQTLNNRMTLAVAWLTILGTALLVPNTIATFYGSIQGINSANLIWYTGITLIATINATVLAFWWVQKKVIMPKTAVDTSSLIAEERKLREKKQSK
ncbi:MAG: CorA family divalent cation transporter [Methanomassiliicoccales archaeon]|nr:CorA family divalent cation transporter [Methanomassiliicoccales archaeon]